MRVLIVGIDSLIGSSVANALIEKGHTVLGTTRRKPAANDYIFFDLSSCEDSWPVWPNDIDVAFIAAAVTRQGDCDREPDKASFVNVDQTLRLIDQLASKNIHIIYPSTNLVLACDRPAQHVDAELNPIGLYGKTKAIVEEYLSGKSYATVARLPKILSGQSGILKDWKDKLSKGEEIRVFSNLIISPVSLEYAIKFIVKMIYHRPEGVWQISGDKEISYLNLAKALIDYLGLSQKTYELLKQEMVNAGNSIFMHPSLDCTITEERFCLGAQPLADVLSAIDVNSNFLMETSL